MRNTFTEGAWLGLKRGGVMVTDNPRFAGRTVGEWDDLWEPKPGGLNGDYVSIHGVVGLYRVDYDGTPIVIGSGTDFDGGGLAKRLQTITSPINQTGNQSPGAMLVRKNADVLTLKILRVSKGAGDELITRKLRGKIAKLHHIVTAQKDDTPDTLLTRIKSKRAKALRRESS